MSEQISNIGPGAGLTRTTATSSATSTSPTRASEVLRVGDEVEVQFGRATSANEATIQVRATDGRSAWSAPERVRIDSNLPPSLAQRLTDSAIARTQAAALRIQAEVVATTPALVLKLAQPGQATSTGNAPGTQAWFDQQLRLALPQSRPLGSGLALLGDQMRDQIPNRQATIGTVAAVMQGRIAAALDRLPSALELTSPPGIAKAVRNSGIWMEAILAGSTRQPGRVLDLSRDLKATLLQLAHSLRTMPSQTDDAPTQSTPGVDDEPQSSEARPRSSAAAGLPDAVAVPGRLLEPAESAAPRLTRQAQQGPSAEGAERPANDDLDASPSAARQEITTLTTLGRHVEGMLKQVVSQQLQALEAALDSPRWLMEIPFRTAAGVLALDADLQRDKRSDTDAEDAWSLHIHLDLPRLGELSIDLNLKGERLNAGLRCGSQSGAAALREGLGELQGRLEARSLEVFSLHVGYRADPSGQRPVRSLRISERA